MAASIEQMEKLRTALTTLETQRALLGDAIEPAIVATRQQLEALEAQLAEAMRAPPEERRVITILFTDIVGSTSLAENLDPEEWRHTVAQLHSAVGERIARYQGHVAQYLGDGLLAFFGAQVSREQDAENAIRAALDAQNAVAHLGAAQPLQIRIGIQTGLVVVGELGAESHKEFTATGDAMNLAARLQSAAPPGGILISGDTYRYVRGVFDVTPQPPLTVKGKREPLQTYLVRRAKPRAFRTATRGVTGIQTHTIGRNAELEQLHIAYLDAYENKRVVWVQLVGEPGVGKSRLVQDMDDWIELRDETVRVLRGRAFAGEQNQPFALIRRMWFDRFQIADDMPRAQAETKWVERFRELTGIDEPEPAHALGLLVGLSFEDSPHIGAMRNDPNQVKGRAFVVSRQALRVIRATEPIRMLLEDLHWADPSSLDYLRQVVLEEDSSEAAGDKQLQGMFVLATARTEWTNVIARDAVGEKALSIEARDEIPPRQKAPLVVTINLAPLSDIATRELAQELLQNVADVPVEVIELIVERAEGVPYFAEEMVNYFLDRGIIDRSREPWHFVPGRLRDSPLPTTLQHLLVTRLGALSDAERAALQRGAIFGRHFWAGGVQALGGMPSPPQSAETLLAQLQTRGFVEIQPESALEGESEWSFHHALLREVTYESVLKRERTALHHKAAAWLEQQAARAGRVVEFAGLLGEHAERAGDLNAAAEWFLRAGERAVKQGATREAKHFFDRALELLPPIEKERRWRALVGREAVLDILGEREMNQVDVNALLTLADELQDDGRRAEALYRQADAAERVGEYRRTVQAAEQAVAAAERVGDESIALRARSLQAYGLSLLGEEQVAGQLAEDLIARARALSDDATSSIALARAGAVFGNSGDLARGAELDKESAEVAQRSGDRFRAAVSLSFLGFKFAHMGLYKLGRATMEEALALNETIGARRNRAYNFLNLGLVYSRLGDGRSARRALDEANRELTMVGDAFGRASGLIYLAYEQERSGDFVGAARRYQDASKVFTEIEVQGHVHDARAGLARCAFAQGQLEDAREYVTQVWNYLGEHGGAGMKFPVWAYLTCADIFDALGDSSTSASTPRTAQSVNVREAIEAGYRELMTRAEKISNPDWRKSFLENVPEHRAMAEMWERAIGKKNQG